MNYSLSKEYKFVLVTLTTLFFSLFIRGSRQCCSSYFTFTQIFRWSCRVGQVVVALKCSLVSHHPLCMSLPCYLPALCDLLLRQWSEHTGTNCSHWAQPFLNNPPSVLHHMNKCLQLLKRIC